MAHEAPIDGEQRLLHALLENVFAGNGVLVLISDEAGISKTALVQDLVALATERKYLAWSSTC